MSKQTNENKYVLQKFCFVSFGLIFLSFSSFFLLRNMIIPNIIDYGKYNDLITVLIVIVIMNIYVGIFVYYAMTESNEDEQQKKEL